MINGVTAENVPAERDGKHGAAVKTSGFKVSVGQGRSGPGWGMVQCWPSGNRTTKSL